MADYIRVATIDNAFEADLLAGLLTDRDIPHLIKSYYDSAYDGLFQVQKGWGAIYASPERRDEVLDAIRELRSAPGETGNTPEP